MCFWHKRQRFILCFWVNSNLLKIIWGRGVNSSRLLDATSKAHLNNCLNCLSRCIVDNVGTGYWRGRRMCAVNKKFSASESISVMCGLDYLTRVLIQCSYINELCMSMNFRRHRLYNFRAISKVYRRAIKANKKTMHKCRNYTANLSYWPALLMCTMYFMAC